MYKFRQNADLTIPNEPLVQENSFLNATAEASPLPRFEDAKASLPRPVWEGHDTHIRAYYKAWELAFGNLKQPLPETGFVSNFIDTAFNNHIFMWDSAFMMMFGKYANRVFNFQKTLDNFYSHQHRDGFICRAISEEFGTDRFTRYDPSATGPEVLPWCEWEYYVNFKDKQRLAKVFPPLLAYHRWMKEHFTWRDGSYFSTGWGCGMDNIPRQTEGYDHQFSHGHMVWLDSCLQELLSCRILGDMAKELGRTEFISELTGEAELLEQVINEKLWDEETGFYYDQWKNGQLNMVRHIGAYWALLAGCASKKQADRLVAKLQDETEFKSPTRVPSLSRSNPNYHPMGDYWRGGVWAPTNYMVLKGLDKYGMYDLAHEIGRDYLASVIEVFQVHNTLFENYAPELVDGKPSQGNRSRSDFVGWTGLAPISVLFEYVFGIKPHAETNRIIWNIALTEKHGVEQYPFGSDGLLTLICEARADQTERPKITVQSNIPVELEIIWGKPGEKQSTILG